MLIEAIEVKNFRCLREAKMDCSSLTAIIGRNGAGKSTFLYALDTFYDIGANITAEDFFDRDTESTIEIRATYSNLREDEKEEFKSYIRENKLIVTKRLSYEDGKISQRYYGASLQIPQFAEIRNLSGKRDRVNAWNKMVDDGDFPDLTQKVRSADQVEVLMDDYERSHAELTIPTERLEQFFGAKAVGGGKLDKYT